MVLLGMQTQRQLGNNRRGYVGQLIRWIFLALDLDI